MEIRFAQKCDISGILCLLAQVGQVHAKGRPDIFRSDALKYDAADLELLLQDASRPILVAVEEKKVLGYAFCIRKEVKNNPVLADNEELYVDDLCVDEFVRGKHIGTRLYAAVLALARELGVPRVTLNVWAFNASALKFYEKCGMKPQRIYMETNLEDKNAE